jgi:hypothetical protein
MRNQLILINRPGAKQNRRVFPHPAKSAASLAVVDEGFRQGLDVVSSLRCRVELLGFRLFVSGDNPTEVEQDDDGLHPPAREKTGLLSPVLSG